MNRKYKFNNIFTLLAAALPFTGEGDRVAVLARGGAGGGGVGALPEGVDKDNCAGLWTLGLFSLSFSLLCEGLPLPSPSLALVTPARFPRALPPPRPVCLTVALKAGLHT